MNELFGILYIPLNEIGPLEINSQICIFAEVLYIYGCGCIKFIGITRLHNHPYLKLQEGTVIAVIDSGLII